MGWTELERLLSRIEARVRVELEDEDEEHGCPLPSGHSCAQGWHWRPGNGTTSIAYARCSWRVGAERQAQAAESYGGQTFRTFERRREPEAYRCVREWAGDCLRLDSRLALIPEVNQASTGCGKTHLLRAAAHELALNGRNPGWIDPGALGRVVRSRAAYSTAARSEADSEASSWMSCRVLFVDGLGYEDAPAKTTAAFLIDLLDQREAWSLALSTNLNEEQLVAHYGAPLASRMLGGARRPPLVGLDYRRREQGQGGMGT